MFFTLCVQLRGCSNYIQESQLTKVSATGCIVYMVSVIRDWLQHPSERANFNGMRVENMAFVQGDISFARTYAFDDGQARIAT